MMCSGLTNTGKPMNTAQSNVQMEGGKNAPDYGRRNPLEVGVQLRNLVNRGDFLTLQYRGGQLVTRILDVDVRERVFVFDWGAVADQNREVLTSQDCQFHAAPDGVRVEFTTGNPRETKFEGRPAFEADFPDVLFYMQRREYFRVDTPVLEPCVCRGTLPDGNTFRFEVHDLSLGGLGLRTTDDRVEQLPMGAALHDVELDLRSQGRLTIELGLVSLRFLDVPPNGARRYHLGFRFLTLPGAAENTLQRYITHLEMKRRSLTRS
jgi:flagellar brake protein